MNDILKFPKKLFFYQSKGFTRTFDIFLMFLYADVIFSLFFLIFSILDSFRASTKEFVFYKAAAIFTFWKNSIVHLLPSEPSWFENYTDDLVKDFAETLLFLEFFLKNYTSIRKPPHSCLWIYTLLKAYVSALIFWVCSSITIHIYFLLY